MTPILDKALGCNSTSLTVLKKNSTKNSMIFSNKLNTFADEISTWSFGNFEALKACSAKVFELFGITFYIHCCFHKRCEERLEKRGSRTDGTRLNTRDLIITKYIIVYRAKTLEI